MEKTMKILLVLAVFAVFCLSCGSEPETFEELKRAGQKAFIDKDYELARDYLTEAVRIKTSDRDVLYFLGLSYSRDYMYDSAYYYLGRANVFHPNDREINLELQQIAYELDEWEAAAKAIKVLIQTGDPLEQWDERLAWLYRQMEKYRFAFYHYNRLFERQPDIKDWYLNLSNSAIAFDSIGFAMWVLDSAISRFGPQSDLLANKGLVYSFAEKHEEAEAILRQAYAMDSNSVATRMNLAHALAAQESEEKKREAYELYSEVRPLVGNTQIIDSVLQELESDLNIELE